MTIGEKIKELRKKANLTQEALAAALNISYQSVSKWESGISHKKRYHPKNHAYITYQTQHDYF